MDSASHPFSNQERLDVDRPLQAAFVRLHQAGPETVAYVIAALLDRHDVPSTALDRVVAWEGVSFRGIWKRRRPALRLVKTEPLA